MSKLIDRTNKKFGNLKVLYKVGKKWSCVCTCGGHTEVLTSNLVTGHTKSCGCQSYHNFIGHNSTTHGACKTKEYRSWETAKKRCTNPNCKKYPRYGGRGITMCRRWLHSFENFIDDMGPCPKEFSIERTNNDGNYEPGNCIWGTHYVQARNRSNNIHLTANGKTQVLHDWAKEIKMDVGRLKRLLKKGKSLQEVINEQF